MRKLLAIAVIAGLFLAALPNAALAGDTHAVRNRWAVVGIGVAVATLGGLLLGGLQTPFVAAPPPVAYMPPPLVYAPSPVVYAPPPPVVYSAPPVIYSPPPVVVYRGWGPRSHWRDHRY